MDALTNWNFNTPVPEVTKAVLKDLIQKKREKDHCKSMMKQWAGSLIFVVFLTLLYLYIYQISGSVNEYTIANILGDQMVWICFAFSMLSALQLMRLKKKYHKADDEFEAIRKDFIERNKEWWINEEQWHNRHLVMEDMKKNFNINIFHK